MIAPFGTQIRRALVATACGLALGLGGCSDDNTGPDTAPDAPTNVQAVAASASSVNLTWGAATGATSYIVERAPG